MWKRRMRRLRRKDRCAGVSWRKEGRRRTHFDDERGAYEVRARTDDDSVRGGGGEGGFEEGEVGEVSRSVRVDEEDTRAGGVEDSLFVALLALLEVEERRSDARVLLILPCLDSARG